MEPPFLSLCPHREVAEGALQTKRMEGGEGWGDPEGARVGGLGHRWFFANPTDRLGLGMDSFHYKSWWC